MPESPVFGPIFVPSTLESQIIKIVQKWYPMYIREAEYQLGLAVGQIGPPVRYTTRNTFDALPGEENPRFVAICPGLESAPILGNNLSFRAPWAVGIGIAVANPDIDTSRMLAQMYTSVATKILLDHAKEIDKLFRLEWRDYREEDLPLRNQALFYSSFSSWFVIELNNVFIKGLGPTDPDPTIVPPVNWNIAQYVIVNVVKEDI